MEQTNQKGRQHNNHSRRNERSSFQDSDIIESDLKTQAEEKLESATLKIKLRKDKEEEHGLELDALKEGDDDVDEDSEDEDIIIDEEDEKGGKSSKKSSNLTKQKYNLGDLNGLSSTNQKFCKVLIHLLLKNKISQKNAFDIKIPVLDQFSEIDFSQHSAWKLLSSGLGAGAKIWGFKVDNTYGETINVLQKLFRIDAIDEDEFKLINNKTQQAAQGKNKRVAVFDLQEATKNSENAGSKTLEQHTDCINADLYDLEFDKDPTFWRTSLSFDIKSAETMLLNKLPMDANFGYVVDSEEKIQLRVDKRLEEIEEREEIGANSANPQLGRFNSQFVIKRKGKEKIFSITLYEVLVSQVEEVTVGEREFEIAEQNQRNRYEQNWSGKLSQILDEGLCEELTQFSSFVQSEEIFSENTQRWNFQETKIKLQQKSIKTVQYDLEKFQVEHQSLEARREEEKREQERKQDNFPEKQVDMEKGEELEINIEEDQGEMRRKIRQEKEVMVTAQQYKDKNNQEQEAKKQSSLEEQIPEKMNEEQQQQYLFRKQYQEGEEIDAILLDDNLQLPQKEDLEEPLNFEEDYMKNVGPSNLTINNEKEISMQMGNKVEDVEGPSNQRVEAMEEEEEQKQKNIVNCLKDENKKEEEEAENDDLNTQKETQTQIKEWKYNKEIQEEVFQAIIDENDFGTKLDNYCHNKSEDQGNNKQTADKSNEEMDDDKTQNTQSTFPLKQYSKDVVAAFFGTDEDIVEDFNIITNTLPTGKIDQQNKIIEQEEEEEKVFLEGDAEIQLEINLNASGGEDDDSHQIQVLQKKKQNKEGSNINNNNIDSIISNNNINNNNDLNQQENILKKEREKKVKEQLTRQWKRERNSIEVIEEQNQVQIFEKEETERISSQFNPLRILKRKLNLLFKESEEILNKNKYLREYRTQQNDEEDENYSDQDECSFDHICKQFMGSNHKQRADERKKEKILRKQTRQLDRQMEKIIENSAKEQGKEENRIHLKRNDEYDETRTKIKKIEEELEEEFNKILQGEDMNAGDALDILIGGKDKKKSDKQKGTKVFDFFQQEEDPTVNIYSPKYVTGYQAIRNYLGDDFYMEDMQLMTDKMKLDVKYVWGYKAFLSGKEDDNNYGYNQNAFERKLFNIGKGTHRIDMRQSQQTEKMQLRVDEGEEVEQFMMIQTSRLKMNRTKEEWERRRGSKQKSRNKVDFDEVEQENYIKVMQPRLRTLRQMIEVDKRKRQKHPIEEKISMRSQYLRNLAKKREMLFIMCESSLTKEKWVILEQLSKEFAHIMELPALRHFLPVKTIIKQFEQVDDIDMEISFDEVVDHNSNSQESEEDKDFINFDLFDVGLYDALDVSRVMYEEPEQKIKEVSNKDEIKSLEKSKQEQEHKISIKKKEEMKSKDLSKKEQSKKEKEKLKEEINVDNKNDDEKDIEKDEKDEKSIKLCYSKLLTIEEDNGMCEEEKCNLSKVQVDIEDCKIEGVNVKNEVQLKKEDILKKEEDTGDLVVEVGGGEQTLKKKVQKKKYTTKGRNHKNRSFQIDLEEFVREEEEMDDEFNSDSEYLIEEVHCIGSNKKQIPPKPKKNKYERDINKKNKKVSRETSGKLSEQSSFLSENNLSNSYSLQDDSYLSTTIKHNKRKKIDKFLQRNGDEESIELDIGEDYSIIEFPESQEEEEIEEGQQIEVEEEEKVFQEEDDHNTLDRNGNADPSTKVNDLSINSNKSKEDNMDLIGTGKMMKYEKLFAHPDFRRDYSDHELDDSLHEQYMNKEFAADLPIDIDQHELSSHMPMVKWEVKLEDMYDEFRTKNPFTQYTLLSPNIILLDTIKEREELIGMPCFLDELNNMQRFQSYRHFTPPLVTDYMGMANKIHMKELIIKIWYRIKRQIKSQKQILVGEKPFSFFDLLLQMPDLIGSQNANAISQQTIFQVILHLANLKNLRLASDGSNLNFFILQE